MVSIITIIITMLYSAIESAYSILERAISVNLVSSKNTKIHDLATEYCMENKQVKRYDKPLPFYPIRD